MNNLVEHWSLGKWLLSAILLLLALTQHAQATKDVLFVAVAGHSPTTYMAATAAELLRSSAAAGEDLTVRLLTFKVTKPIAERFLKPSQVMYYDHRPSWTVSDERHAKISLAIGESNFLGVPAMLEEMAQYYERDHLQLQDIIDQQKPDLMVIDMFATSAHDFAEHLGIPHMTFYHPGAFGVMGIEDSFATPDLFAGTGMAQQGLRMRIFKVFQFVRTIVAFSKANSMTNEQRKRLGLATYEDPQTNILRHPIIATNFWGFEYPRPVSPLTRLVGMFSLPPQDPATFTPGSNDAIAHDWMSASSKPVVYAAFGTEAYPLRRHFVAVIQGVLAAGMRLVLLARQDVMDHYGLQHSDLVSEAGATEQDALVLPWIQEQRTALGHPAVKAYICHGGIMSTTEAIDAGVPLVMLPANADRNAIAVRMVEAGVALQLDQHTMTAADVTRAIKNVTEPARVAAIRAKMAWMRRVNTHAGSGVPGAAAYIREVLDVGYAHLVPFTLDMNPLAVAGLDAVALVLGSLLLGLYLAARALLWALGCGRKGARKAKRE